MKRLHFLVVGIAVLASGCKSLKEQQLPEFVGDAGTKTYYKNVPTLRDKVPAGQRIFFKDADEAMGAGFHSAQEGSDSDAGP